MDKETCHLEQSEFPQTHYIEIEPSMYHGIRFSVDGTEFNVLGRKENGIGTERLRKAILLAWPKWTSYFPLKCPPITIIDSDLGLGGGAVGPFTLAVYLKGDYDADSSKLIESILGWKPQKTGTDYIEDKFSDFEDPMQAYVNDQVVHELGHIFFLRGITDLKNEEDTWFSLGIGMVYDRLIWNELSDAPSPIFEAFHHVWKDKFANNSEIDQRLINPNTENDKKFELIRIQTYGHAKSAAYLSELRLRIGSNEFDVHVRAYLDRPIGSSIEYEQFLSYFSEIELKIVSEVESEFGVR